MPEINLEHRILKIDNDIFDLIKDRKITYSGSFENSYPAIFFSKKKEFFKKLNSSIKIHKLIMCPLDGFCVDHINGDKWDCRRSNLRLVNYRQNAQNCAPHKPKSGYKGVRFNWGKFEARITVDGKQKYLGAYKTPVEAAKVYDLAALKFFGSYSRLNFPPPKE